MIYSVSSKIYALTAGVLAMVFLMSYFVFAWQDPYQVPPGGNVPAPVNVGVVGQRKTGDLGVVGFRTDSHAWLATDGGNVGIGTTGPLASLGIGIQQNVTNNSVAFIAGRPSLGTTAGNMTYVGEFRYASGNVNRLLLLGRRVSDGINWQTSAWRIQPAVDNSFTGESANRGYIEFHMDNVARLRLSGSGASTPDMVVTSAGNVGIGTPSPRAKLNVDKGIAIGTGGGVSETHGNRRSIQVLTDTSYGGIYDNHSGFLIYSTMPGGWGTARLHFARSTGWGVYDTTTPTLSLSGSNVGIGTTDPGSYKLYVNGNVAATAFYYTSDINLKTDIQPLSNSLEKILSLQGISFNWKDSNEPSMGFIAQEVEQIFPEAVSGSEGEKAIDYAKLIAPMIEAIKEQQKEIEELKAIIQ